MHISGLAPELLRQCLKNVDSHGLNNTSLVCKDWLVPSREFYWDRVTLRLPGYVLDTLVSLVDGKTTIPHRAQGFIMDESEMDDDDENNAGDDAAASWRQISRAGRGPPFQRDFVTGSLVIQNISVERAEDLISLIVSNKRLKFLGLGSIKCSIDSDSDDAESSRDQSIELPRLNHLVVFSDAKVTWSEVVPAIGVATLKCLKTLVIMCHDNRSVARLVGASTASLLSLALGFVSEGAVFDLNSAKSLTSLSIDLKYYPWVEGLLSDLVDTIATVSTLKHLLINCGPALLEPDQELQSAGPLWNTLDSLLSVLPGLESIMCILVTPASLGISMGPYNPVDDLFVSWKNGILHFIGAKLPVCREKGLIRVTAVVGSWIGNAFADIEIPE
ncbi:hypothetical protein BX600DRAFT_523925 [Xylariales sp. PMI_506]|nr:hypothetical protein BX600DRAFT_523925 [Xylariales sp. PMI_506]